MNIQKMRDESDFAIDIKITLKDTSQCEVATFGSEYLLDKTIGFLFLGLTWGEGLLHREWISRFDYLIILFSGLASAMCLSILLFVRVES